MPIDVSKLTLAELEDLITRAAKQRSTMNPPITDAQPQGELQATFDPKWYITGVANGTLLQIKDPGHGWLNYIIAPASRTVLLSHMLQHALMPPASGTDVMPAPIPVPAGGGGRVH